MAWFVSFEESNKKGPVEASLSRLYGLLGDVENAMVTIVAASKKLPAFDFLEQPRAGEIPIVFR